MTKKQKEKDQGWLSRIGRSVAGKLSEWIDPLSPSTKKRGALVLGISVGVACVMMTIRSFQNDETSRAWPVDRITMPADTYMKENDANQKSEQSLIGQYNRMIRFKELVDRLDSSSDTQSLDSLRKAHPGLLDSLNTFMETYYSH